MALEGRLLDTSKRTGLPLTRLRKAVVFERMLARLIREDDPGAVRYQVRAELPGRTFEEIRVDVAFGDPRVGAPERVRGPASTPYNRSLHVTGFCTASETSTAIAIVDLQHQNARPDILSTQVSRHSVA
jgi:hypothetical protein